ncbi:hypothetical protein [Arthrobacter sp. CJ23]|uniref:hypothetical protein n=1 Tax=Arthrobacter sp. CJ23 TaxID=2972479 RepID=UPI00215D5A7A|nr:hypothetical protein [Arthrobacter sp. CJ23]UVJ37974.1 hypothetical protein NVV90_11925 [Arthrobacter sp. CJ23]
MSETTPSRYDAAIRDMAENPGRTRYSERLEQLKSRPKTELELAIEELEPTTTNFDGSAPQSSIIEYLWRKVQQLESRLEEQAEPQTVWTQVKRLIQ